MRGRDKWLVREFLEFQREKNQEVSAIAPLNGTVIVTGQVGRMDSKSVEIKGYIIPVDGCIFKKA